MSKEPNDYTIFKKTTDKNKKVFCVYFRDEDGKRMNPIYVSRLKKMIYKSRKGDEPIKDEKECLKICEKCLNDEEVRHFIFDRKKPLSTTG